MSYQDDHQETKDLAMRFVHVFDISHKHVSRREMPPVNEFFRELNINQLRAMSLLYDSPGMAQKDLAERLEVTPAAISTAVSQMEGFGLLERRKDEEDKRSIRLFLSADGQQIIETWHTMRCTAMADLLSALPLSEQRMVVEALERALASQNAENKTTHLR